MRVVHCRVNHLKNPLGFALENPVFSWQVEESAGHTAVSSRLEVARDPAFTDVAADTGEAELDSLATELPMTLAPRTRYYWRVTVCTDAQERATGETQWFETAKQKEPWQAKWVACIGEAPRHPIFLRDLPDFGPVTSARLYVCGLGLYEVYVDGLRVGEEYLAPGCQDYRRWLQYQTLDLTRAINGGARQLQILLGNGWYAGRYGLDTRPGDPPFYGREKKLIAELHVRCRDGREYCLVTDESWRVRRSNLVFSGIYEGEGRDDTMPPAPEEPVRLCREPEGVLTARFSLPVKVQEERKATLLCTPAGEQVLDIGQNLAGIFRLHVHGVPAGQEVLLQFGEVLQDGCFYRDNLRTAAAEYRWRSAGTDAVLEPHFTFYGYRYVRVQGYPGLKAEDFTALPLWSDVEPIGTLTTGHPLLNRLIENVRWGQRSNFIDLPTDCPQRDERLGWTGDAQVFAPTACYFTENYAFYRKYLHDMAEEQAQAEGRVPNTVPSVGRNGDLDCSAAWGDAVCILPWVLYLFSGDKRILEEQYISMRAWVDYITGVDGTDHGWRRHFHFGDWLALDHPAHRADTMQGATDKGLIADSYYLGSARIVARTAALLGRPEEARRYEQLAEKVLEGIRGEYFSPTGRCCVDTQTAHLLTLHYGLWPDTARAAAALRESLALVDNELRTGFVGTPLLCPTLSQCGMDELAWDLLLREEYPGWLHEVKLGATTVWERWNSLDADGKISSTGMNSLNHYSYGAVLEWVWQYAAGLQPMDSAPGFRTVRIAPRPDRRIGHLCTEYHSAAGRYAVAWKTGTDGLFTLELTVPFGCRALVELPFAPTELYKENNPLFADVDKGVCRVGAGHYAVTYRPVRPLGKVFHLDTLLGKMLDTPEAAACLRRLLPAAAEETGWRRFASLRAWLEEHGMKAPENLETELEKIAMDR